MNFKKDYINFVLYSILNQPDLTSGQSREGGFHLSGSVRKLLEKVISSGDFVKITYLVGKTAGLELLFKYLIYISDKIDKSQITIFNLKDNFDYDVQNLKRICSKLEEYRSTVVSEIEAPAAGGEEPGEIEIAAGEISETEAAIKVEAGEQDEEEISGILEHKEADSELETAAEERDSSFTVIGHEEEGVSADSEVFDLPDITQPPAIEESEIAEETREETVPAPEAIEGGEYGEGEAALEEGVGVEQIPEEVIDRKEAVGTTEPVEESDVKFEFEVRTPGELGELETEKIPEASEENTLEKLKSKFFEEMKILEKLLFHIEKDYRNIKSGKVKPSVSRRLSEITLISGELSQLTKLLSMDDISRIFFSLSLYFAKVTETPGIIKLDDLRLLLSSLDMVNIILKGGEYSNYEQLLQKVDDLRNNLSRKPEAVQEPSKKEEMQVLEEPERTAGKAKQPVESEAEEPVPGEAEKPLEEKTAAKESEYPKRLVEVPESKADVLQPSGQEAKTVPELDSANFKMRYLVKDFEKNFLGLSEIQGEYGKFDALEKIDELNNLLRMVARISASAGFSDVLKLAEVSYVFLKYLKDYRMNVFDPEIQQIVKYIIFTFKMLLTDRKPEDFDILVQYLNNPVKIFTDS